MVRPVVNKSKGMQNMTLRRFHFLARLLLLVAMLFALGLGQSAATNSDRRVTDPRGLEGEAGDAATRSGRDDDGAAYPLTVDLLSAPPNWTTESNQGGAMFGISVSSAGDVNGDSYSDVIVGAYQYDNGQTDEGRAFVYLGSAAGLHTTPAWTAESNQGGATFGISVSSAGDVNGDGYDDVIVGASQYGNGQFEEGRAYVYHGSATGLNTTPDWTAESNQADAWFGDSVSEAGDVNGDGYDDVIVGAPLYDNGQTNEGRAFVYLGSTTGLRTSPAWTAENNQANSYFGDSVSAAGDVNGDGYEDVIVGVSNLNREVSVYVYHGSAYGLEATANWSADTYASSSVSAAGDINGDGFGDVIVGSAYDENAYIFHGSAAGLNATPAWTAESDLAYALFGASVSTVGDVNDDGYSDIIVGAPHYIYNDRGRVFVYHGSASGLSATATWTAESNQAGTRFGGSVSEAGDVNGDGYDDVIVGAYLYDNGQTDEGRAYAYHGSATPAAFSKSAPANSATAQPTFLTLSWALSNDATSYQYCYDTANDDSCAGTWLEAGANTSAHLSGLLPLTTYYWQVRATSLGGTTYANSESWWSFSTGVRYANHLPVLRRSAWMTLINDGFEGSFPGVWQVLDSYDNGQEHYFNKRDCRQQAGAWSAWAVGGGAEGGALACGANYPDDAESWMVYGPFSLLDAAAADLTFQLYLNSEPDYDGLCRLASVDGNEFYGNCTTGSSNGWVSRTLDLTAVPTLGNLTGRPNVWVAFVFASDYTITYPEGAYVDRVVLRKYVPTQPGEMPQGYGPLSAESLPDIVETTAHLHFPAANHLTTGQTQR